MNAKEAIDRGPQRLTEEYVVRRSHTRNRTFRRTAKCNKKSATPRLWWDKKEPGLDRKRKGASCLNSKVLLESNGHANLTQLASPEARPGNLAKLSQPAIRQTQARLEPTQVVARPEQYAQADQSTGPCCPSVPSIRLGTLKHEFLCHLRN
jgi:hypothetical protein